jgi:large subunit ribosomal protein L25
MLVLTGKPEGVKNQGGILEQHLRTIEVECLPADIPNQLEADVSALTLGHALHVSDLSFPNITVVTNPGTVVAAVTLPAAERATEDAAATAAAGAEGAAAVATAAPAADAKPAAEGKPAKESKGKS